MTLNVSTVAYISTLIGAVDILYLTTIYFCIVYNKAIQKHLIETVDFKKRIEHSDLREFIVDHQRILEALKKVQTLSSTFMFIMYFSSISLTCFIGLVLTTVTHVQMSLY